MERETLLSSSDEDHLPPNGSAAPQLCTASHPHDRGSDEQHQIEEVVRRRSRSSSRSVVELPESPSLPVGLGGASQPPCGLRRQHSSSPSGETTCLAATGASSDTERLEDGEEYPATVLDHMSANDLVMLTEALREVRNPLAITTTCTLGEEEQHYNGRASARLEQLVRPDGIQVTTSLDWSERVAHRLRRPQEPQSATTDVDPTSNSPAAGTAAATTALILSPLHTGGAGIEGARKEPTAALPPLSTQLPEVVMLAEPPPPRTVSATPPGPRKPQPLSVTIAAAAVASSGSDEAIVTSFTPLHAQAFQGSSTQGNRSSTPVQVDEEDAHHFPSPSATAALSPRSAYTTIAPSSTADGVIGVSVPTPPATSSCGEAPPAEDTTAVPPRTKEQHAGTPLTAALVVIDSPSQQTAAPTPPIATPPVVDVKANSAASLPHRGFLRLGNSKPAPTATVAPTSDAMAAAAKRAPATLSLLGRRRVEAHPAENSAAPAVASSSLSAISSSATSAPGQPPTARTGRPATPLKPTSAVDLVTSSFSPLTPALAVIGGMRTASAAVRPPPVSFEGATSVEAHQTGGGGGGAAIGGSTHSDPTRGRFISMTPTPSPHANTGETPGRRHKATRIPLPYGPPRLDFGLVKRTVDQYYELTRKISEGTYGEVYIGREKATGAVVALKRLKTLRGLDGFPITSLREVIALKHITRQRERMRAAASAAFHTDAAASSSPTTATHTDEADPLSQIITLRDVLLSKDGTHDIFLVFDYSASSLAGLLTRHFPFALMDIAFIFRCLLIGVQKLHAMGILHRDIKSDNVLLGRDGRVQLADFGLCMFDGSGRRAMTPSMINLSYRPPEMLLGSTAYDTKVDVWSIGCFLAQVFLLHPPFHRRRTQEEQQQVARHNRSAETELEQLALIAEVLGPLSTAPADAFPASTCAHLGHLCHLHERVRAAAGGGGRRGYGVGNPYTMSSATQSGGRLFRMESLFEPSFLYAQFGGFRRWFLAEMDNRRAQRALSTQSSSTTGSGGVPPRPPLLVPSPACLDVLTAIFRYDPRQRPTAAELLRMPFFQLLEDGNVRSAFVSTATSECPSTAAWKVDEVRRRDAAAQEALARKLQEFPDSHSNPRA